MYFRKNIFFPFISISGEPVLLLYFSLRLCLKVVIYTCVLTIFILQFQKAKKQFVGALTSIVKGRQGNQWHHLPAYSCTERGIAPGGGGVQYTCLVGCRLPPLDVNIAVCLVLTIEFYGRSEWVLLRIAFFKFEIFSI